MARRARKSPDEVEWIGGTVTLPATVTDEGEPYRPDLLLWLVPAQRMIVGTAAARPDELPGIAADSLRDTIAAPAIGPPGPPTRLRVATRELADALRADFPDIELVVAPTPELDEVAADLAEHIGAGPPDPGWLAEGLAADAVGGFFDAMAALWRAAPWESVPGDDAAFGITVEALDVHDAVAVVIGQMGDSFGVMLFDSFQDRDRYVLLGEAMQRGDMRTLTELGGESGMPDHTALSFDPADDITPVRRGERETHGWALADERAFPSLMCFDANLQDRSPTARDLALGETLARTFAAVVEDEAFEQVLEAYLDDDEAFERELRVPTHDGEVAVRVRAPIDDPWTAATRDPDAIPERVYRLKLALERCNGEAPDAEVSRTVELAGDHTLWDLHHAIQQAFGWDDDHLFEFFVSGKLRDRKDRYTGSPMGDVESFWTDEDDRSVTTTTLDELGLKPRRVMRYVFDEHIVHRIGVSTVRDGGPDDVGLPHLTAVTGEAPPQYGDSGDESLWIVEE